MNTENTVIRSVCVSRIPVWALGVICSLFSVRAAIAQCAPNISTSFTSPGCCYWGPQCECDPEEHEFTRFGLYSIVYSSACNPDENISYWEPIGPTTRTVMVAPWTNYCGINYNVRNTRFFMTYSDGCAQCGYEDRIRTEQEDCSG